jgi:hypothetical protein
MSYLDLLSAAVGLAIAAATTGPTHVVAHAVRADMGEFSQVTAARGALSTTAASGYDGERSYDARYCGGPGNGYARGVAAVRWPAGATRSYGVALYLPAALARHQQGEIDLLRWDNYPLYGVSGDYGGVVLFHGDGRARLQRGRYAGDAEALGRPFRLPRDRWFWLEVRQTLSDGADARSTVRIDGRPVVVSRAPNAYGREVRRVRFGIVAVDDRAQRRSLHLYFDRAAVGTTPLGPLRAADRDAPVVATRPAVHPEPVPAACRP